MKKKVFFNHLIGEGIGPELAAALEILMKKIPTIEFDVRTIESIRLPETGELNTKLLDIFKTTPLGLKGPMRTEEGKGARSLNVGMRQHLDLFANIRPVSWFPGVQAPVKHPELLNVVIFRENTEDVYMGIEKKAGSEEVKSMLEFLYSEWNIVPGTLPDGAETGIGIKIISRTGTERIMREALEYAITNGLKTIGIAHKGNIMKCTEGAFLYWAMEYAKKNYRDKVYCWGEEDAYSDDEKNSRIFIDKVTADDAFSELLLNPERFDVIVTSNLNGDYLSDAAAAQVGGVPTAAGANIGENCAIFEAVGGTGDKIAGKDKANPTAYFLAFAMMLSHAGHDEEAQAIEDSIKDLFKEGFGTFDMKFEVEKTTLSLTEFATKTADAVESRLAVTA